VLEEIADFFDEHTDIGRRYRFGKILANSKAPFCRNWIINGKRPIWPRWQPI